eukprot:CAMPEP_0172812480 /NCGR_PEP_ID=MMETSP1075-20121228/10069_1 /TAXON_ID=2916 /ORGANISM="Ceratium fusus, Strain PA161109" /LENGTH=484 /DNA_ID=CAMNT_0013652047 /DNA_START=39 /DNA_END=1493 /DNA_ORIENTATION=+
MTIKGNSFAARRAKMMEIVPPLSLGAVVEVRNQVFHVAVPPMAVCTPKPLSICTVHADVQSLSLCARRGLEQLQIHLPPRDVPRIWDATEKLLHVSSPSTCHSSSGRTPTLTSWTTSSSKHDESWSPPRSDFTMHAWDYETGTLLGVGSMASVYKVTRRSDRKEFAAKCVLAAEADQVRELCMEYDTLKRLHHSSVVRVTQMHVTHTDVWLCMELCRGGSIEDHIMQHGAFAEGVVVALARQLLEGLDYLVGKRIVHRDVKPMNLLLQHKEEPTQLKIADFNAAQRLGRGAGCSAMLSARGTQLYAAPELRFGLQWNERIDVWASGLCIFVMLCARHPFSLAKRQQTHELQQGRLPPLAWGAVSKPMRNLVKQCLTVDMRDRPLPMELLEHCIFSTSNKASLKDAVLGSSAVGSANAAASDCFAHTNLAACGILMQRMDALHSSKALQRLRSPRMHTIWQLSKRRYQLLEGEVSQPSWAWTSPI